MAFNLLTVPDTVDIVMVAPRMIGAGVRDRFVGGEPYPCFVSVERDVSGKALDLALSIARGIGATRGGAVASSAREETALDLFSPSLHKRTRTVSPRFLSFILACSQIQLREPEYTCL